MKAFLITTIILLLLDVTLGFVRLSKHKYPRTKTVEAWEDVFSMLVSAGFAVWGSVLLGWI